MPSLRLRTLSLALLTACGGTGSTGLPGSGPSNEVFSVRLFDSLGIELTQHMALFHGDTLRVRVRLYAADGREITDVVDGARVGFTFTPDSLATSTPVPDQPLMRDVIPTATVVQGQPLPEGGLTVSLFVGTDTLPTKAFGRFDVLVHT
jgi:hypothetical protein